MPLTYTFSRPVSSGWKPTPNRDQRRHAAATPRTRPGVGAVTPASRRSSVDLPEPLRPMMPTHSPGADVEIDVAEGPEAAAPGAGPQAA